MKIGVFEFAIDQSEDPAVLAKRAEELGFASFWVPEHPIIPIKTSSPYPASRDGIIPDAYGRILDPFVALARASAVTKKLQLGTGICLIPERNPLLLAKEVATLDKLSGGRFLFGIGAGWLKEETEIMGGNFERRWGQTKDAIMAMKELWTKDEAAYQGKFYNFPAVRSFPKPTQKPHPPIFMGGSSQHVFKRVVEWGDGWMPVLSPVEEIHRGRAILNDLAIKVGRDPKSIQVLAFGQAGKFRTRDEIKALEKAGTDHVTIWLTKSETKEAVLELEQLAREVLA
ncbi:MAG: LLM class F420-dependent oxidoreductase [Deltaproteobacteria bacterium]|nr:LLM class F420-dependent oxidoreductase [Deltaproteobacteria bacterium]